MSSRPTVILVSSLSFLYLHTSSGPTVVVVMSVWSLCLQVQSRQTAVVVAPNHSWWWDAKQRRCWSPLSSSSLSVICPYTCWTSSGESTLSVICYLPVHMLNIFRWADVIFVICYLPVHMLNIFRWVDVICYLLSVICPYTCWTFSGESTLSVICYLLSVICYLLSVIGYLLSVICYLLSARTHAERWADVSYCLHSAAPAVTDVR